MKKKPTARLTGFTMVDYAGKVAAAGKKKNPVSKKKPTARLTGFTMVDYAGKLAPRQTPVAARKKKTAPRKTRSAAPKSGLTGFLVIWRHTMDDVPVGLFSDYDDAVKFATTMRRQKAYEISKRLEIDCATPVCFAVVQFDNGAPVHFFVVDRRDDA